MFLKDLFYSLIWAIFVQGPLLIINAFNEVIKIISYKLVLSLIFKSDDGQIDYHSVTSGFWIINAIAISLLLAIFLITVGVWIIKHNEKFTAALQMGVRNLFVIAGFILFLPFATFLFIIFVNEIAELIGQQLNDSKANLADVVYVTGAPNLHQMTGFTGSKYPFNVPGNIGEYNIFATMLATGFVLIGIFIIGFQIIQKVIEAFILFIFAGLISITSVFDNMKRLLIWKDLFIAKILALSTSMLAFYIYSAFLNSILFNFSLKTNSAIVRTLIILFASGGGILAILGFSNMIAAFIGESASMREGLSSIKSTIAAGSMIAGGFGLAGKALKFGTKAVGFKKIKPQNLANNMSNLADKAGGVVQRHSNKISSGLAGNTGLFGMTARGLNFLKNTGAEIAAGTFDPRTKMNQKWSDFKSNWLSSGVKMKDLAAEKRANLKVDMDQKIQRFNEWKNNSAKSQLHNQFLNIDHKTNQKSFKSTQEINRLWAAKEAQFRKQTNHSSNEIKQFVEMKKAKNEALEAAAFYEKNRSQIKNDQFQLFVNDELYKNKNRYHVKRNGWKLKLEKETQKVYTKKIQDKRIRSEEAYQKLISE